MPDFRQELDRLQTFDTFPLRYISASQLASDGFVYVKGTFVKCYRCNAIIDCLQMQTVKQRHKQFNPSCGARRHHVDDGWATIS